MSGRREQARVWAGALGILVAFGGAVGGAMAQSQGLSEAERQLAYRVEEAAVQQLRAAPNNPWVGKSIPQLARTPAGLVK